LERISKFVFALEALLLAYLTFLGLLLVGGSIVPVALGSWTREHVLEAAIGAAVLMGLVCGWRLAFAFLFGGRLKARLVAKPWWAISSAIAVGSTLAGVLSVAETQSNVVSASPLGILGYGVLFVPSFLHLSAEVWLRAV
jgi:hypothetical protein